MKIKMILTAALLPATMLFAAGAGEVGRILEWALDSRLTQQEHAALDNAPMDAKTIGSPHQQVRPATHGAIPPQLGPRQLQFERECYCRKGGVAVNCIATRFESPERR